MSEISADIRARLVQPACGRSPSGSPSRTASTTCSRVCGRRSPSRYSATTWTRCAARRTCCARRLAAIPGVADLEIEKQVLAPQIKVRVDYAAAAQYGVPAPQVLSDAAEPGRGREGHADRRRRPPLCAGGEAARGRTLRRRPAATSSSRRPPGACRCRRSPPSRTATGRTRSAATTASGASCCLPTRRDGRCRTSSRTCGASWPRPSCPRATS